MTSIYRVKAIDLNYMSNNAAKTYYMTSDTNVLYCDDNYVRNQKNCRIINTEIERVNYKNASNGQLYYIWETNTLWQFNGGWTQLAGTEYEDSGYYYVTNNGIDIIVPDSDNGILGDGSVVVRDINKVIKGKIKINGNTNALELVSIHGGGMTFYPQGTGRDLGKLDIQTNTQTNHSNMVFSGNMYLSNNGSLEQVVTQEYVNNLPIWNGSILALNSVTGSYINNNAIVNRHINNNAIESRHISYDAIKSCHINSNAITSQHISNNVIYSRHIYDNTIVSRHIKTCAIQRRHIEDGAIGEYAIDNNVVLNRHIHNNAVESRHINRNIIIGQHINSNAIESRHIVYNAINSAHINNKSILSRHIENNAITPCKTTFIRYRNILNPDFYTPYTVVTETGSVVSSSTHYTTEEISPYSHQNVYIRKVANDMVLYVLLVNGSRIIFATITLNYDNTITVTTTSNFDMSSYQNSPVTADLKVLNDSNTYIHIKTSDEIYYGWTYRLSVPRAAYTYTMATNGETGVYIPNELQFSDDVKVSGNSIANYSIGAEHIYNNAVQNYHINNNAVESRHIKTGSITKDRLDFIYMKRRNILGGIITPRSTNFVNIAGNLIDDMYGYEYIDVDGTVKYYNMANSKGDCVTDYIAVNGDLLRKYSSSLYIYLVQNPYQNPNITEYGSVRIALYRDVVSRTEYGTYNANDPEKNINLACVAVYDVTSNSYDIVRGSSAYIRAQNGFNDSSLGYVGVFNIYVSGSDYYYIRLSYNPNAYGVSVTNKYEQVYESGANYELSDYIKLSPNSVENTSINNNAVLNRHISCNAIVSRHINSNAIVDRHINDNVIVARHINNNAILNRHISCNVIESRHINNSAIYSRHIGNNSVKSVHINNNAIESRHIGYKVIEQLHINSNAIESRHINNDAVESRHIYNNTVKSRHIGNNAIESRHINYDAIQSWHIDDNVIISQHIESRAVQSRHINNYAIESLHINDNAIESRHISNIAIESRHISNIAIISRHISNYAIESRHINYNAIEYRHINNDAVWSHHIKSEAIVSRHISNNAIDSRHINNNAIQSQHIGYKVIDAQHINSVTVNRECMVNNTIIGQHINNNAIESRHINSYAIYSRHIDDNAIYSRHIDDNAIYSRHIDDNAIQSRHIGYKVIESQHINSVMVNRECIVINAIIGSHINSYAIESRHIDNSAIESRHIDNNAIYSRHIDNSAIESRHISNSAIISRHIDNNSIGSRHIVSNTVQNTHILPGAITMNKLYYDIVSYTGRCSELPVFRMGYITESGEYVSDYNYKTVYYSTSQSALSTVYLYVNSAVDYNIKTVILNGDAVENYYTINRTGRYVSYTAGITYVGAYNGKDIYSFQCYCKQITLSHTINITPMLSNLYLPNDYEKANTTRYTLNNTIYCNSIVENAVVANSISENAIQYIINRVKQALNL